jgi:hypothetical protein
MISMKPCIRNIMMKNVVENASEKSPKNMVKNQMLKWASEGGSI